MSIVIVQVQQEYKTQGATTRVGHTELFPGGRGSDAHRVEALNTLSNDGKTIWSG